MHDFPLAVINNLLSTVNLPLTHFIDGGVLHYNLTHLLQFDWYMKTIVKEDVFVPSDEAVAYGYFNSKSGHVCFRQTPAMIFLGYYGCKMHSRGKMFEYLKSGQLRSGNDCITNGGKGRLGNQ